MVMSIYVLINILGVNAACSFVLRIADDTNNTWMHWERWTRRNIGSLSPELECDYSPMGLVRGFQIRFSFPSFRTWSDPDIRIL